MFSVNLAALLGIFLLVNAGNLGVNAEKCPNSNWSYYEPENVCVLGEGFQKKNWFDAQLACRNHPDGAANLVKIGNAEKNDFIISIIELDTNYWIGLGDIHKEGYYIWTDWTPLTGYAAWAENNPSNSGGEENCIEFQTSWSKWNDNKCDVIRGYLCEMPAYQPPAAGIFGNSYTAQPCENGKLKALNFGGFECYN